MYKVTFKNNTATFTTQNTLFGKCILDITNQLEKGGYSSLLETDIFWLFLAQAIVKVNSDDLLDNFNFNLTEQLDANTGEDGNPINTDYTAYTDPIPLQTLNDWTLIVEA
jgi:hypothetical protein